MSDWNQLYQVVVIEYDGAMMFVKVMSFVKVKTPGLDISLVLYLFLVNVNLEHCDRQCVTP